MLLKRTLAAAMTALVLCAAASPAAAQKNKPASGPAWVDFNKVFAEYRKTSAWAKVGQTRRDMAKTFSVEMTTLASLRYCTDTERDEALALKKKIRLNEKEQTRLDELTKRADKVDNEMNTLSQKASPTDAETKRIAEISKMRTDAARGLAKAEADRREQLAKLENDALEDAEKDILLLVEKIAKDQKLEIVYERRGVLYGGIDLTDQVIKKLPK
jgi:outer membrane protein